MQNSQPFDYNKAGKVIALGLLSILVVFPLCCLIFQTMDLSAPLRGICDSHLREVFINSLVFGGAVVLGTTILALPLAWILAKTDLGRHGWLDIFLMIPLMTPPYIGSMGWILFMQKSGYLEQLLPFVRGLTPGFFSFSGMVFIMSLQFTPFLYLILRNGLVQISGNKEAAATVHGGSFSYTFRRIFVPLLLSNYALGALLVFVKTIAEFGIPATFGRKIGYAVLTSEIYRYLSHWPYRFWEGHSSGLRPFER